MIVVAAIRIGDMLSSKDKRLVGFEQPRRSFVLTCFILEVIGVNIKDVLFTFSSDGRWSVDAARPVFAEVVEKLGAYSCLLRAIAQQ